MFETTQSDDEEAGKEADVSFLFYDTSSPAIVL